MASTTIEDKIALFSKLLFEKIDKEYSEKVEKLEKNFIKQYEDLKRELEKKKKQAIEQMSKRAMIKRQQMVSKARYDQNYAILKKKEEFVARVMEDLKSYALEYTKTDEYKDYLKNHIQQVSAKLQHEAFITYYFTKRDIENFGNDIVNWLQSIRGNDRFSIEYDSEDIIGGFLAQYGEKVLDATIKTAIEDSRQLIGQLLEERLGEG